MKYVIPACLLVLASCATALEDEPPIFLEEPTPTWSLEMTQDPVSPDAPEVVTPETPREDPPRLDPQGCDDSDNLASDATDLRADARRDRGATTYTARGALCRGDEDWFLIELEANRGLHLNLEGDYLEVTLYVNTGRGLTPLHPNGRRSPELPMGSRNPMELSLDAASLGNQNAQNNRFVYVRVANGVTAPYTLTLTTLWAPQPGPCSNDAQEPNDSAAFATQAPISERTRSYTEFALTGSLCDPRDSDWYVIDYVPGLDLEFEAVDLNETVLLEVQYRTPNGTLAPVRAPSLRFAMLLNNREQPYLALTDMEFEGQPEQLFLRVSPQRRGAQGGPYDMRVRTRVLDRVCLDTPFEPNDEVEQATPLELGRQVRGHLCTPGDTDWFVISDLTAGVPLDIELHNVSGSARAMVFTQGPDGRMIPLRDDEFQPLTLDTMGSYFASASPMVRESLQDVFIRVTFVEDEVYYLTVQQRR